MKWIACLLFVLLMSCTKELDLSNHNTVSRLVIEGRISSLDGPYYVRVTRSTGLDHQWEAGREGDTINAVKDATVIISDDSGLSDTLAPCSSYGPLRYYYRIDPFNNRLDSLLNRPLISRYTQAKGYYQTTKLKGSPGHTYHLLVKVDGQEYRSSAYMPPVTPLDSAKMINAMVMPNGEQAKIPAAWFSEPQNEKNYYQLTFNDIQNFRTDNAWFTKNQPAFYLPFYVFSDQTLPAYVNGIGVQVIIPEQYEELNAWPHTLAYYDAVQVRLHSLTKEAFDFFNSINRQLQYDGNVYKPVPTSAPGNIDNNAIGLFWASDISYRLILPN